LTARTLAASLAGKLQPARSKVIPVDFAARRRARLQSIPAAPEAARFTDARQALAGARDFVLFWRPPSRRSAAEYLGGRWDWGWTLFVWTSESAVGPVWSALTGARGYVAQRLARPALSTFLGRAGEIGGLLLDGELEAAGDVIRAEPDQLIRREDALSALAR
jgi:hypothetical protein